MKRSTQGTLVITMVVAASLAVPEAAGSAPVLNGLIAWGADRGGNDEVYVMGPDGSNPTNLTNNPATDGLPAWSPDGTRIAFWSNRDGVGNAEIYVMSADGSGQTNVSNTLGSDQWPTWSPDGTKIAFRTLRDGDAEIYVMNADGSNQVNLSDDPADDTTPTWSPDGSKIAFMSDRDGGDYDIFVMNASDGSNQTNITNNTDLDKDPAWSPDGTKIAFISDPDGDNEVFVMGADGSGPTPLTNNDDAEYRPAWAPDGTRIAFERDVAGVNLEIYVMNADGSGQTNLTGNPDSDESPAWQPVPVPPFAVSKSKVKEGKAAKFQITLAEPTVGTLTLAFQTAKGTAKPGKDFQSKSGSLTFLAGETTKRVKVNTREDRKDERKERFFLEVSFDNEVAKGKGVVLDDD